MAELTISSNEFKVLSSDTRIRIMKLLKERNHTLTELSKKLELASPTVKQHLEMMLHSDLIAQNDEGRKWKYYALTRKGKNIIKPEETNVVILLAASGIGLIAVLFLLIGVIGSYSVASFGEPALEGKYLDSFNAPGTGANKEAGQRTDETTAPLSQKTGETAKEILVVYSTIDSTQTLLLLALTITFSVLIGLSAQRLRQKKFAN